jgi:hypothetical protein
VVLGAVVEAVDGPGAPPNSPDFNIVLAGQRVPLEVTRATDGALRSYYAQVSAHDWEDTRLQSSWAISVGYGAAPKVKALRTELSRVLAELEAAGITQFDVNDADDFGERPDPSAPWASLAPFGVRRGRSVQLAGPSRIWMGSSGAFSTNAEVVNGLVRIELGKVDNRAKVGDDGHLFVWVESLSQHAHVAMELDIPPEGRPDGIPPAVGVWVARVDATSSEPWIADRIWRLPPRSPWLRLDAGSVGGERSVRRQ